MKQLFTFLAMVCIGLYSQAQINRNGAPSITSNGSTTTFTQVLTGADTGEEMVVGIVVRKLSDNSVILDSTLITHSPTITVAFPLAQLTLAQVITSIWTSSEEPFIDTICGDNTGEPEILSGLSGPEEGVTDKLVLTNRCFAGLDRNITADGKIYLREDYETNGSAAAVQQVFQNVPGVFKTTQGVTSFIVEVPFNPAVKTTHYRVVWTLNNSYGSSEERNDAFFTQLQTGIADSDVKEVSLSATNTQMILVDNCPTGYSLTVYNMLGQPVINKAIETPATRISLSEFPTGQYIAQLKKDGAATITRSVINARF